MWHGRLRSLTHITARYLLFHSIAFLIMTLTPVSLSMRLPAIVDRPTHRAGDWLLNPLAAYLTAPQVAATAHDARRCSVSKQLGREVVQVDRL